VNMPERRGIATSHGRPDVARLRPEVGPPCAVTGALGFRRALGNEYLRQQDPQVTSRSPPLPNSLLVTKKRGADFAFPIGRDRGAAIGGNSGLARPVCDSTF
jgi:hypothetical protein